MVYINESTLLQYSRSLIKITFHLLIIIYFYKNTNHMVYPLMFYIPLKIIPVYLEYYK